MSERELNRIEVLSRVDDGTLSARRAADLLDLSRRQIQRLMKRLREDGGGIRHRARGRASNNRTDPGKRELALDLIRESYSDFGPTLAAEMLRSRHGFDISRETVRTWMKEAGIWLTRAQRRRFHQPRLRRDCLGELIQIDGSEHHWFEDRAGPCTLLVFIDDATSTLMHLRFVKSESTFSYFEALEGYLAAHGRPVAFYSDKHSVFRVAKKEENKGGQGVTQFGRALSELNIEILCANSSQAKGRVERANRTLQDRLVKELRLEGISDMEAANAFLPGFMERHNFQFAKTPRKPDNLHRPLNVEPERLAEILCWREKRCVSQRLTLNYNKKHVILTPDERLAALPGKYVDVYEYPDGRLEVRWKGVTLPGKIFDKEQRVTQGDIAGNKRLSEVLEWIKEQQEARDAAPKVKIKTNSEKIGYQSNGRAKGRPTAAREKPKARPPAKAGPPGQPGLSI